MPIFKRRIFTRKVIYRLFQLTVWTCSRMRTPRLSRRLPAVRLGYVTEMHWPRGPGKTPWDLRTRDEGLEDIKFGTRGSQIQGRRGHGMSIIITKVGGKCDINLFPHEYVLVKATHPALLRVPSFLFTKRRLGEDPALKKVTPLSSSCAVEILEPNVE